MSAVPLFGSFSARGAAASRGSHALQVAAHHAGHNASHGPGVHRLIKKHFNRRIYKLHNDANGQTQLRLVGARSSSCQKSQLSFCDRCVRGEANLLQDGDRAQRPHDPYAPFGSPRDIVGFEQQSRERLFKCRHAAREDLFGYPTFDALVLTLHESASQFGQQRVLVRKVPVQRRGRQPSALADEIGRQPLNTHVGQRFRGSLEDALDRVSSALLNGLCLRFKRWLESLSRVHEQAGWPREFPEFEILPQLLAITIR